MALSTAHHLISGSQFSLPDQNSGSLENQGLLLFGLLTLLTSPHIGPDIYGVQYNFPEKLKVSRWRLSLLTRHVTAVFINTLGKLKPGNISSSGLFLYILLPFKSVVLNLCVPTLWGLNDPFTGLA